MFLRPFNPNYYVTITNYGSNTGPLNQILAMLPDQFNFGVKSDWEPTLANMMGGVGGALGGAGRISGWLPIDQLLTGQVWRSNDPLDFSLSLQFDAMIDPINEVRDPVMCLMMWASPIRAGGFGVHAPGPTIWNQDERISLQIGNYIYMESVIFPEVDVTWYAASDGSGQMIAADVSLQVRTFFTPMRDDIEAMFFGASGGGGGVGGAL